jgi:hypothetical protein
MTTEDTSIATQAPAAGQTDDNIIEGEVREVATPEGETEAEKEAKPEAKPEKTAEQREIERLRRGIDRRTRQLSDARAQLNLRPNNETNQQADDSEPLSLTRSQLHEMVTAEAEKLAPTFRQQAAETERRQGVVQSLAKTWGQERFDEVSAELDDVFGGLTDRSGKPKPAMEAVFESDSPKEVIEWLTDPENADEAERISRLDSVQAGRAIAKLEARISDKAESGKPKPSKAPAPLEAVRGQGNVSGAPDPSDTKRWIAWRNEQERKGQ